MYRGNVGCFAQHELLLNSMIRGETHSGFAFFAVFNLLRITYVFLDYVEKKKKRDA